MSRLSCSEIYVIEKRTTSSTTPPDERRATLRWVRDFNATMGAVLTARAVRAVSCRGAVATAHLHLKKPAQRASFLAIANGANSHKKICYGDDPRYVFPQTINIYRTLNRIIILYLYSSVYLMEFFHIEQLYWRNDLGSRARARIASFVPTRSTILS